MTCEFISKDTWDWKKGVKGYINLGKYGMYPTDYFRCGLYYYDGLFQVVKFPKGMSLYHGSRTLAENVVEFPIGKAFYEPIRCDKIRESDQSGLVMTYVTDNKTDVVEALASINDGLSESWFAEPDIAKLYSIQNDKEPPVCGDKCVLAYKLKRDTLFVLLDDDSNIISLLANPMVPAEHKKYLKHMWNISDRDISPAFRNYVGDIHVEKRRQSYRELDLPFSKWLCQSMTATNKDRTELNSYAGYASRHPIYEAAMEFHMEFMFCDATKWLERDLDNEFDFAYKLAWTKDVIPMSSVPDYDYIKLFMKQLELYKTTNTRFHSGNLLEHSIWSVLHAEQEIVNFLPDYKIAIPEFMYIVIAVTAFLHDIGKMDPVNSKCVKRVGCLYFDLPNHPQLGADYVSGKKLLPILDEATLLPTGEHFALKRLIKALSMNRIDVSNAYLMADMTDLIKFHWTLGGHVINVANGSYPAVEAKAFLNEIGERSLAFVCVLLMISTADVLASQPYGVGKLPPRLNYSSTYMPFISNMPKKYKGGNCGTTSEPQRTALIKEIIKLSAEVDKLILARGKAKVVPKVDIYPAAKKIEGGGVAIGKGADFIPLRRARGSRMETV